MLRVCCLVPLLLPLAAGLAAEPRVATLYSNWSNASFRGEWDGILKQRGLTADPYANTQLADLAAKLDQYDVVIGCSVFNLEPVQDFGAVAEPFLAFLRRGGIFLATDASYESSLARGIGRWAPEFALGTATAGAHTKPSDATRRLTLGPDPGLAGAPHALLPLAEAAGHWAHLVATGDRWRRVLLDSDGQPTLVWQPVGQGLLAATSYFSVKRANVAPFAGALLDNLLTLRAGLQAGWEVRSLTWGGLEPGRNEARLTLRDVAGRARTARLTLTVRRGDEPAGEVSATLTAPAGGEGQASLTYTIPGRGPHRVELVGREGDAPKLTLTTRRDIPAAVRLFAWQRHFHAPATAVTVRVDLTPEQPFDAGSHQLVLQPTIAGTSGRPITAPAASGELTVPLAGLPIGAGTLRARLLRGDAEVATAELPLTIAGEPYVRILPDRSCTVGGRPYFPMGMYIVSWSLPGTPPILEQMRAIAAAGFNLVHVGVRSEEEFRAVLAEARRLNLMILPEGGVPIAKAAQFKDDPTLLAWNPGDEPDGQGTPPESVAATVARLKDQDPGRPTYMTLCVPGTYQRYYRAADILAPDPYPVPRTPIGYVAQCIEGLQNACGRDRPIWAIPQAFGGYSGWTRPPTPDEERNMTYQCLVHGVRGLVYYTYFDNGFKMTDHPDLWAMLSRLAGEVKELTPLLLDGGEETVLKLGPAGQAHVLLKSTGGVPYLLAVNTTTVDLGEVKVPLPAAYRTLQPLFGDPPATVAGGAATLTLPPLAVRVYRAE